MPLEGLQRVTDARSLRNMVASLIRLAPTCELRRARSNMEAYCTGQRPGQEMAGDFELMLILNTEIARRVFGVYDKS
jgi:hypothetical protein